MPVGESVEGVTQIDFGLRSFSLAVVTMGYTEAARIPPPSEPAKLPG
jgi:hypothetical protein